MFDYASPDDLVAGFTICNKDKVIDYKNLTPESALYWCEIVQYLRKKEIDNEELIESILPSLTEFCEYVESYFEKHMKADLSLELQLRQADAEEKEFIAEQLLKIVSGYDLSDNAGRQRLNCLVRKLTGEADVAYFTSIVPALAKILTVLHNSDHEAERITMAAEMIQVTRENCDSDAAVFSNTAVTLSEDEIRAKQIQLAKIRVNAIELSEDLDEKIANKDFSAASEIQKLLNALQERKEEIEKEMQPKIVERQDEVATELSNDPATILKCLQISKELCSSLAFFTTVTDLDGKKLKKRKALHPTILELVNTLILPSIANPNPGIREVAVECLGNCCLYSFDLSAQHLPLFLQIIQADVVEVRVKALASIVDILRIFGVEGFAPDKEKASDIEDLNTSGESEAGSDLNITTMILSKIISMLDEDNETIRFEAASGLAMILISGRVVSPAIFSRLVLLWYNPTTQEEHNTLNKIGCFLDAYPYMCRATHNCVGEAFLPTLRTLFDAPNSSPLASVSVDNVAQLLVHLTRPSAIKSLQTDKENDPPSKSNKSSVSWLEESSAHDSLAVKLCAEILRDPQSIKVGVLSRTLSMLELSAKLEDNMTDLSVLCEQMIENVKNKQALRYLKKFQTTVLDLLPNTELHGLSDANDKTSNENLQENLQHIEELDTSETTFHIQRKRVRKGDPHERTHSTSIRA